MSEKYRIFLDDERIPVDKSWVIVKSVPEFAIKVIEAGWDQIEVISLDHDLGEYAIREYFENVLQNFKFDYNNLKDGELTGYHAAKWLVDYHRYHLNENAYFPQVYTHSANPIGSANIMGYINTYMRILSRPQTCVRVRHEIERIERK